MNDLEHCLQLRSREKINMASDLEEEMQSESDSLVDIRELLPRDGPVAYNCYGSLVAEGESPETQENVDEADARVETEVVREPFCFLTGLLNKTFQFLFRLSKCNEWLFIRSFARVIQNVAERRRREVQAVRAEMQTRNALHVANVDKKNSSVRMAKMRPSNGRMHRDYPVVHSTVTEQKLIIRRRKSR